MLEVEQGRIRKWDGHYPTYLMQFGGNDSPAPNLLLEVPRVTAK